jgi:arsenate reductase (thioredoxin)
MKIAFVCIHNSCRSQMAEAWAKALAPKEFEIYSAGTEDYPEVKPLAKKAMEEVGITMADHHPKLLKDIPNSLDVLITMGCGVECPYVPARFRQDWGLEDPSGGPYEGFLKTRDIIKLQVEILLEAIEDGSLWNKKSIDLNLK